MANVFLDSAPFRMHTTPFDVARESVIGRMYGQYNVRPGWWYPRSPYGMGGLEGLGYTYYDLLAQAGMESCSPMDSACVSRNVQRQNAVEDYWVNTGMTDPANAAGTATTPKITVSTSATEAAQYAADAAAALPGGNIPQTGGTITTGGQTFTDTQLEQSQGWVNPFTRGAATGAGGGTPTLSFTTSSGNTSQLRPGDTWRIQITGAKPNSPVVVSGGQNGRNTQATMGTTDGSGSFVSTGSIDTSMIGNWSEAWSVGGTSVGSFSFTVIAATQAQQSAATGKPNASVPPSSDLTPMGTGFQQTGSFLSHLFGGGGADTTGGVGGTGISPTVLLVAGAAALFLFTRGGK